MLRVRGADRGDGITALVIGARGRCGRGACAALRTAGIEPKRWGTADTREPDRAELIAPDILVNAVGVARPLPPFLTKDDLDAPARRLSVLCDVTCDVGSPATPCRSTTTPPTGSSRCGGCVRANSPWT